MLRWAYVGQTFRQGKSSKDRPVRYDLQTLTSVCSEVRVAQSLAFRVVFCYSLFAIFYFFF